MSLTFESLIGYLNDQLGLDTSGIGPDSSLFQSAFIDSFSLIDLIMFVEGQIGVKIEPEEVQIENFDSISRILAFAQAKLGQ